MNNASKEQIDTFLKNIIDPQTFNIFAALSNLKNIDVFKEVLNLLYSNKITFMDLNRLPVIDDPSIEKLIANYKRFNKPYINEGLLPSFEVVSLLNDPTKDLAKFLLKYNEYINFNFGKEVPTIRVDSLTTNYKDGMYSDYEDFIRDFVRRVLQPLLEREQIVDVASMFPVWGSTEPKTTDFGKFIQRIYDTFLMPFQNTFNNAKLAELFVYTPEAPSTAILYMAQLNNMVTLKPFSSAINVEYNADIIKTSVHGTITYTRQELDELWENLFSIDLTLSSLTDILAYIRYKGAYINTLEQYNNGTTKNVEREIDLLIDVMTKYRLLHQEVEQLITSSLFVKAY